MSGEHRAVDTLGLPCTPVGAFDFAAHDRWAAAGHCPVVSVSKAWCGKAAGHGGDAHGSPFLPPHARGPYWAEWYR